MTPRLTVIVPSFNEGPRLEKSLNRMVEFLKGKAYPFEILIVDDGSTDDTPARMLPMVKKQPELRLIRCTTNQGKGASVRSGLRASRGQAVLFCDADGATPLEEIDRFLPHLEAGADLVTASRHLPGSCLVRRQRRLRRFLGGVYRKLCIGGLTPGITDVTCGFKLLSRRAVEIVAPRLTIPRWSFDAEIFTIARLHGLRVVEVPIRWEDQGKSKVRFFSDVLGSFLELVLIWRNKRRGLYR
ncbi:MAG: glycosyltransferase [Candidatus Omnitrophica bacterium]|nr:glycosyltransferase [Candidatus Omnitrophota bacterium]